MARTCSHGRLKISGEGAACEVLLSAGHLEVILKRKQKSRSLVTQSIFLWNVLLAFLKPKDIWVYLSNQNGVVMAFLQMSAGFTGIW
jgi:hypothetical protein